MTTRTDEKRAVVTQLVAAYIAGNAAGPGTGELGDLAPCAPPDSESGEFHTDVMDQLEELSEQIMERATRILVKEATE